MPLIKDIPILMNYSQIFHLGHPLLINLLEYISSKAILEKILLYPLSAGYHYENHADYFCIVSIVSFCALGNVTLIYISDKKPVHILYHLCSFLSPSFYSNSYPHILVFWDIPISPVYFKPTSIWNPRVDNSCIFKFGAKRQTVVKLLLKVMCLDSKLV